MKNTNQEYSNFCRFKLIEWKYKFPQDRGHKASPLRVCTNWCSRCVTKAQVACHACAKDFVWSSAWSLHAVASVLQSDIVSGYSPKNRSNCWINTLVFWSRLQSKCTQWWGSLVHTHFLDTQNFQLNRKHGKPNHFLQMLPHKRKESIVIIEENGHSPVQEVKNGIVSQQTDRTTLPKPGYKLIKSLHCTCNMIA